MKRALITGAGGFVGGRLAQTLAGAGVEVIATVRQLPSAGLGGVRYRGTGDLRAFSDWESLLEGVDVVLHLAARAHVVKDRARDPVAEFRANNVLPSTKLFRAAQVTGVRRFVFASSIGVNGVRSAEHPFREADAVNPTEPYAVSKWEAEQALRRLAERGPTELVILRPALVYGPNARGNFHRLMRLVAGGWPIPLGAVAAKRNFLGVRNLCELLCLCAVHPMAANETFLAAEPTAVTLPALLQSIAAAMGRSARLWSVPAPMLKACAHLAGRRTEIERLMSPLEVDSAKLRNSLGWTPRVDFHDEIDAMVRTFMKG